MEYWACGASALFAFSLRKVVISLLIRAFGNDGQAELTGTPALCNCFFKENVFSYIDLV